MLFQANKELELKRREEGQAMLKVQSAQKEQERMEMAKERKKKREDDQAALRRIKEQIAQDR